MNPLLESDEMEDIEGMYMDYSPEELELPVLAFDFEDGEYIAEDDLEIHRPAERDDFSILPRKMSRAPHKSQNSSNWTTSYPNERKRRQRRRKPRPSLSTSRRWT